MRIKGGAANSTACAPHCSRVNTGLIGALGRGRLDAEEVGEDAGGVVARIDLIVDALDDAILVD